MTLLTTNLKWSWEKLLHKCYVCSLLSLNCSESVVTQVRFHLQIPCSWVTQMLVEDLKFNLLVSLCSSKVSLVTLWGRKLLPWEVVQIIFKDVFQRLYTLINCMKVPWQFSTESAKSALKISLYHAPWFSYATDWSLRRILITPKVCLEEAVNTCWATEWVLLYSVSDCTTYHKRSSERCLSSPLGEISRQRRCILRCPVQLH